MSRKFRPCKRNTNTITKRSEGRRKRRRGVRGQETEWQCEEAVFTREPIIKEDPAVLHFESNLPQTPMLPPTTRLEGGQGGGGREAGGEASEPQGSRASDSLLEVSWSEATLEPLSLELSRAPPLLPPSRPPSLLLLSWPLLPAPLFDSDALSWLSPLLSAALDSEALLWLSPLLSAELDSDKVLLLPWDSDALLWLSPLLSLAGLDSDMLLRLSLLLLPAVMDSLALLLCPWPLSAPEQLPDAFDSDTPEPPLLLSGTLLDPVSDAGHRFVDSVAPASDEVHAPALSIEAWSSAATALSARFCFVLVSSAAFFRFTAAAALRPRAPRSPGMLVP